MKKRTIQEMSLREKIGQTAMVWSGEVRKGVELYGGLKEYFQKHPFAGFYMDPTMKKLEGDGFATPESCVRTIQEVSETVGYPLLVACDYEYGAYDLFNELHAMPTNMSLSAAGSKKLAYQRGYYFAKEVKSFGVNWHFGPVGDMLGNFFDPSGIRCMSDGPEPMVELLPEIIGGLQDAGVAATAKHFPGTYGEYRDAHFSPSINTMTREEWDASYGRIWKACVEADVSSFMISHTVLKAVDSSCIKNKVYRPSTASKKVIDILRKEYGYEGVILTDAITMRGITSSFDDRSEIYIECFNAGNDLILFPGNDYIDVMEKAVLDGRVSKERLNQSVERILRMKERFGMFDAESSARKLTSQELEGLAQTNYEIGKKAITIINNESHVIPFDPGKVKKATIISVSPHKPFLENLKAMVNAFEERGIEAQILDGLKSKQQLKELSEDQDIIIYACYMAMSRPQGMTFYSRSEDMVTLISLMTCATEKSVVASFGATSIYYNYFEGTDPFLNAYSTDAGTMKAFVDGILGDFTFSGKSPVALKPAFQIMP